MVDVPVDLGEITYVTGKVRITPTELIIEDPKSPMKVINAQSAPTSASAQKGSDMAEASTAKPVTFWGVVWALILVFVIIPVFAYYITLGVTASMNGHRFNPPFGQITGFFNNQAPPAQQGFGNVPGVWTNHGPDSCGQFGLAIGQETVINGQRIVCRPDE